MSLQVYSGGNIKPPPPPPPRLPPLTQISLFTPQPSPSPGLSPPPSRLCRLLIHHASLSAAALPGEARVAGRQGARAARVTFRLLPFFKILDKKIAFLYPPPRDAGLMWGDGKRDKAPVNCQSGVGPARWKRHLEPRVNCRAQTRGNFSGGAPYFPVRLRKFPFAALSLIIPSRSLRAIGNFAPPHLFPQGVAPLK